jgi:hypothetical protein
MADARGWPPRTITDAERRRMVGGPAALPAAALVAGTCG